MHTVASFTKDRKPLKPTFIQSVDLEYCFDSPTKWKQYIYAPMVIHFSGWAVSLNKSPITITIVGNTYPQRTLSPEIHRPDVKRILNQSGKDVDEYCGFEFKLSFDKPPADEQTYTIEITNDKYSSGPIAFTVKRFDSMRWPSLDDFSGKVLEQNRSDYKTTWNSVSKNEDEAKVSVAGDHNEDSFRKTAEFSKEALLNTVGVHKGDVVLEIGCGVGRMAPVLGPICQRWIGTDVSENMLKFARNRTLQLPNVEFVALNGWDLAPISSESVDLVYCTVVFMHIDEWERYNYICEAKRVLRPGGRLYVDNFSLTSEEGWKFFMKTLLDYHPLERPPNISKSSTPDELRIYFERAGFQEIIQSESNMWICTWGVKP